MRILIATGIYPPEIGGHSFYAQRLKEELEQQGHFVRLVLYGRLKKFPSGVRHLLYTLKLLWNVRGMDGVIAFDTFTVAIPAAIVATLAGIRVVNRAGGDFIWEHYIARTNDLLPLPAFYAHRYRWNLKERIAFRLIRAALSRVHVVFSSVWMRDIWQKAYMFAPARVHVIENAIEKKLQALPHQRKNYLFYTRTIALKNHAAFREAFAEAKKSVPDIELDEGVVGHEELMQRMREGYAVVLPSISEITPNYIIESIRRGKPFLLTKHSGYAERFKEYGVIVDPLNIEDMARGIRELADPMVYSQLSKKIAVFGETHTYADIAREFTNILQRI